MVFYTVVGVGVRSSQTLHLLKGELEGFAERLIGNINQKGTLKKKDACLGREEMKILDLLSLRCLISC